MTLETLAVAAAKHAATQEALAVAIEQLNQRIGPRAIAPLAAPSERTQHRSTGSLALDRALGIGGWPAGRIAELFGDASTGKTTLALHAIACVQRAGGTAVFVDAEHALDLAYAEALGVRSQHLLVAQPDSAEDALDVVETMVRSGSVDLVVIDSVAALVPRSELEAGMGELHTGQAARLMAKALRKVAGIADRTGTTTLFVNQTRFVGGAGEVTPGGRALKFFASTRVRLEKRSERLGVTEVRARVVKNKLAAPFQEVDLTFRHGSGVDGAAELTRLALSEGLIRENGPKVVLDGEVHAESREAWLEQLRADEKLQERIRALLGEGVL